jgi:hypothetical protein
VRRRHVGQPGVGGQPHARRDRQPLGVHRHRYDPRTRAQQGAARPRIARLLHPDPVARIEQQAADQLEALLGPGHDQYLVGAEAGAARGLHVIGDGLAQRAEARRLPVVELGRRDPAQPPTREPPPERRREQIHSRRPDPEGARRPREAPGALGRRRQRGPAARQGRMPEPCWRTAAPPAREIVRQLVRHEGAGAAATAQVAFRLQLLERE